MLESPFFFRELVLPEAAVRAVEVAVVVLAEEEVMEEAGVIVDGCLDDSEEEGGEGGEGDGAVVS